MSTHAIFSGDRAQQYDAFVQDWIPYYADFMCRLPDLLDVEMTAPNGPILVAGCGTGNELATLAQVRPQWELWGIDPSPEMIAQARRKLRGNPQVFLEDGYVHNLPNEQQYRAATLLLVLHFVPDNGEKLLLLRALAERLQPGAPLFLLDIFGTPEELQQNLQLLRTYLPETLDPVVIDQRMSQLPSRLSYVSEDRLRELLQAAGFTDVLRFHQATIYGGWIAKKA